MALVPARNNGHDRRPSLPVGGSRRVVQSRSRDASPGPPMRFGDGPSRRSMSDGVAMTSGASGGGHTGFVSMSDMLSMPFDHLSQHIHTTHRTMMSNLPVSGVRAVGYGPGPEGGRPVLRVQHVNGQTTRPQFGRRGTQNTVVSTRGEPDFTYESLLALDDQAVKRGVSAQVRRTLPKFNATRMDEKSIGECQVCKERVKVNDPLRKLPCNHTYHDACIMTWFDRERTCPVCRFEVEK